MDISFSVRIKNKVSTLIPPRYVRLMDTIEYEGVDQQTRNEQREGKPITVSVKSIPDVHRGEVLYPKGKKDFVLMTKDIQDWMFRICVEVYLGRRFTEKNWTSFRKTLKRTDKLVRWWTSLHTADRAFNNQAGFGNKPKGNISAANFIAGEDIENEPPKLFQVVTGQLVGRLTRIKPEGLVGGVMHLPIEAINISKGDYKKYHPFNQEHKHLFFRPYVTGRDIVVDKSGPRITKFWRQPFSQFDNKVCLPIMLRQDDEMWLPVKMLINPSDKNPGV